MYSWRRNGPLTKTSWPYVSVHTQGVGSAKSRGDIQRAAGSIFFLFARKVEMPISTAPDVLMQAATTAGCVLALMPFPSNNKSPDMLISQAGIIAPIDSRLEIQATGCQSFLTGPYVRGMVPLFHSQATLWVKEEAHSMMAQAGAGCFAPYKITNSSTRATLAEIEPWRVSWIRGAEAPIKREEDMDVDEADAFLNELFGSMPDAQADSFCEE